jgi:hypothetical protein
MVKRKCGIRRFITELLWRIGRFMETTKKGELLQFRGKLEEEIKWLNQNEIIGNKDEITREVAVQVRKKLIEANNIINEYRLRELGW